MPATGYMNFDLLVTRAPGGYRARVIQSPLGEAVGDFAWPFGEKEVQGFLRLAGRLRWACPVGKDAGKVTRLEPKEYGARLYEAVFGNAIGVCLERSLDEAKRNHQGLRIRLRVDRDVPELAELPWEYLFSPKSNHFLALSDTPIVRYLEVMRSVGALQTVPSLNVLGCVSDPSNVRPLQVEREWQRLRDVLVNLSAQRKQIDFQRLEATTLPALQAALRRGAVHILHFIGHGYFDATANESGLIFEDGSGQSHCVSAETLGMLLYGHEPLRLVFLNACESARGGQSDILAGVAQHLVQQGVPIVLAMQFPVRDTTAIRLAHQFYSALVDGYPADTALGEARKAVAAQGNRREWATPVMFSRLAGNMLCANIVPFLEFEPETVYVPAGSFLMGSLESEGTPMHEMPQHRVELPAYRIGKYPIKNKEYAEFIRQTGRIVTPQAGWQGQMPPADKLDHPVSGVSWYDALAYCEWLSDETGRQYRLPSEAQWEKAARGSEDGRIYPWDDEWSPDYCNHSSSETTPVGAYPEGVSPYGCYDMVGNVREWTSTLWGEHLGEPKFVYPWASDHREDLSACRFVLRVYRGGGAGDGLGNLRCSARGAHFPDRPGPPRKRHGFRVVLLSEQPAQ
jgi:formylglycine-generating enzyme required for sulfatase activity